MRLAREEGDALDVPGETYRRRAGVRGQPAVVMPAALAEPGAVLAEPEQRHEQQIGHHRLRLAARLHQPEGADLAVGFVPRIRKGRELHRRAAMREAGQRQWMAALMEEPGIARCGRLMRGGVVEPDGRPLGHQLEQRRGRAVQDQRAGRGIERGDMRAPRGAELLAEGRLVGHGSHMAVVSDEVEDRSQFGPKGPQGPRIAKAADAAAGA